MGGFFLLDKVVKLVDGGSVIMEGTTVTHSILEIFPTPHVTADGQTDVVGPAGQQWQLCPRP